MKKTSLILAFLIGTASIAFAAGIGSEGVNQQTLHSFQTEFRTAADVSWSEMPTCYRATFRNRDQIMYAYYDKSRSELIAVTRNLSTGQLPLNLQKDLRELLNTGWLTELFEVSANDETAYYATIETSGGKTVLKSNGNGHWTTYSRSVK